MPTRTLRRVRLQRGRRRRTQDPIPTTPIALPLARYLNLGAMRRVRIEVPDGWIEGPVMARRRPGDRLLSAVIVRRSHAPKQLTNICEYLRYQHRDGVLTPVRVICVKGKPMSIGDTLNVNPDPMLLCSVSA